MHDEFDIAADHHAGKLRLVGLGDVDGADVLALAQDGAAVSDRHDLVELMGNEEDGLSLGRQILHDLEELFDLLRRQNGRRLVEDEDLIVAIEHLEDLGALLHADRDVLDQCIGVNVQAVALGELQHLLARVHLLQKAALVRLDAEDDIVENREALDELEMLVHHADAQCICIVGVVDLDLNTVFLDGAFLRLIQAEEHTHERGFSRAVFAEQGVNLTVLQLERDVIICDDAGEAFGDIQHLNRIRLVAQSNSSSYRLLYNSIHYPTCNFKCKSKKCILPVHFLCVFTKNRIK